MKVTRVPKILYFRRKFITRRNFKRKLLISIPPIQNNEGFGNIPKHMGVLGKIAEGLKLERITNNGSRERVFVLAQQ